MKTTPARKKPGTAKLMTPKVRLEELQAFIALCFHCLEQGGATDYHKMAELTGLHYSTLYRLHHGEATLAMRFNTIQVLGIAAGLRLEMRKDSARLLLID